MTAGLAASEGRLTRRPLFWVVLTAFPVGLAAWMLVSPGSFEPSVDGVVAQLFAAGQLVIVLVLLFLLDTRRTVPLLFGTIAFVWGVVVATPMSIFANTVWIAAWTRAGFGTVAASLAAPIDEELSKAVGALLVLALLLPRRIGPLQGVVVGFLVGAGFEIAENVTYAVNAAYAVANPSHSAAAILDTFVVRSTSGFLLHALCTGVVGAGIALALTATTRRARIISVSTTVGLLLLALTLHALWDLPQLFTSSAASELWSGGLYAVIIGTFLSVWWLARRADQRSRRAETGIEPPREPASASPTDVH